MNFLGKLLPFRDWLYLALAVAAVIAFLQYRASLIEQGRAEVRAAVQHAVAQQQEIANQKAQAYEAQRIKTRIEYRTRVKEVIKRVPINHSCDLPADAVRMLNDAITGRADSGKPSSSMSTSSGAG